MKAVHFRHKSSTFIQSCICDNLNYTGLRDDFQKYIINIINLAGYSYTSQQTR